MKFNRNLMLITIILFKFCSNIITLIKKEKSNDTEKVALLRRKLISYLNDRTEHENLSLILINKTFELALETTKTKTRITNTTALTTTEQIISITSSVPCSTSSVVVNATSTKDTINRTNVELTSQNININTSSIISAKIVEKHSYLQEIALIICISLFFIQILIIVALITFKN
jgi:hypothetical protein